MEFTIGADPEFFVRKKGVNVSAHKLVEGDKDNPLKLDKRAVQVDGNALEFNIDPVSTRKDFMTNINTVMDQIRSMVPEEYEFDFSPSIRYEFDVFKDIPQSALELGCDPDFDAYTGKQNVINNGVSKFLRTAAGHLHFGLGGSYDPESLEHPQTCRGLTAILDSTLGIALAWMTEDNERSKLYGKPGAYRPKEYGVEWRTASNSWLRSDALKEFVWDQIEYVHDIVNSKANPLLQLAPPVIRDIGYYTATDLKHCAVVPANGKYTSDKLYLLREECRRLSNVR